MSVDGFAAAVAAAVGRLGPGRLRALADGLASGQPRTALPALLPVAGFAEDARAVLTAQEQAGIPDPEAVAYLRGVSAGFAQRAESERVEVVWSGPSSHAVPVRATASVLEELVSGATAELLLMTYSAKPYTPLLDAMGAAADRGVAIAVVVETLQGAGGALTGTEPAAAFAAVRGVKLWHWPADRRTATDVKMHAKLAVADRSALLVSSANLTQSGIGTNIEAGLLVQGGRAPQRAAEHVIALMGSGQLVPLRVGL